MCILRKFLSPAGRRLNKLPDGNHRFGRRCTAALTHPVTVGALGLLLLNDLVFKALWSNPWTTGKLSDLAWVIFASPLLAFLLSPIARKGLLAERIVFVTAYAGLPILYAAFNTFPVVHDAILWALSFAGGTGLGAPHDPTDSLVIPFGLAVALWVWRRSTPVSNSLRMRFGLVIAGVAALASVASTPPDTVVGVTAVEVAPDGTIISAGYEYDYWAADYQDAQSVETPRGTYTIEGPDIMRTHNGEQTVAYSAKHLSELGNINLQRHVTRDLGPREITTEPYSIIYDERSGNVVVAMGLQGAVVGTPDGRWMRIAVGRYVPNDFSIVTKLLLLRDGVLWLAAVALVFSFVSFAIVLTIPRANRANRPALILSTSALTVSVVSMFFYGTGDDFYSESIAKLTQLGSSLGLVLGLTAVVASIGNPLRKFSGSVAVDNANSFVAETSKRALTAITATLVGMLILFSLSFLLWAHIGIDLTTAKMFAILLLSSATYVLQRYLAGRPASGSTPCPYGSGGETNPR